MKRIHQRLVYPGMPLWKRVPLCAPYKFWSEKKSYIYKGDPGFENESVTCMSCLKKLKKAAA